MTTGKGMGEQPSPTGIATRNERRAGVAQQLRTETQTQWSGARKGLREAKAQAELVLLEARTEAERMLQQARNEEQRLAHGNDLARRQFQAYLQSYRQLLDRQLAELSVLGGDEANEAAADDLTRAYRRQA